MIYLIIYLIGCVIAYLLCAYSNDKSFYDKMGWVYVFLSWCMPLSLIMGIIIHYSTRIPPPSLKVFKRKN